MTDEELESLFEEITDGIATSDADEIAELKVQLNQLDEQINETKAEAEPSVNWILTVEQQIEAVRVKANEQINALHASIRDAKEKAYDAKKILRVQESERDKLQREIDQRERSKIAAQKFEMLETKWTAIFERLKDAFPHQTEGARKIATQRRMILADTMGLGKTRTVAIAIDLIQSATAEATELHPVIYETQD